MLETMVCPICGDPGAKPGPQINGKRTVSCRPCSDAYEKKRLERKWYENEPELQLELLTTMYCILQRPGSRLYRIDAYADLLNINGLCDLQPLLNKLEGQKIIMREKDRYGLTSHGVDYLLKLDPHIERLYGAR